MFSQTPHHATNLNEDREPGETTAQWRARRHASRVAMLLAALDGVELRDHDRRIVEWLAGRDTSVIETVADLFRRVRAASPWGERR